MKKNEIKEMQNKTYEELVKMLADTKAEIASMKIDAKLGKVTNTSLIRTKKKNIARIMTFLSEKKPSVSVQTEKKQIKEKEKTTKVNSEKKQKKETKSKTEKGKGDNK